MKIQHLAIIFLLIILPIDIVLGLYLDAQINTIRNQALYDSRLVGCVYDALEVYQSNSIVDTENNIVTAKMNNIEASASTFLTSLQSAFGYSGYKATVMQEYVPAVVYTMYDGYYIYSKFNNTLSNISVYQDSSFPDGVTVEGLKSYVFYSCRYQRGSDDFVITYTLDNYITIQGKINGNYINESGYLIDGIEKNGNNYIIDGLTFCDDGTIKCNNITYDIENRIDYIGNMDYKYTKINGTKYYLDNVPDINKDGNKDDIDWTLIYELDAGLIEINDDEYDFTKADLNYDGIIDYTDAGLYRKVLEEPNIFHIVNGAKLAQAKNNSANNLYAKYEKAITKNKDAYLYYKEAYEFTKKVRDDLGLKDLKASDAVYINPNTGNIEKIKDFGNYDIFEKKDGKYIQDSDSDFNQHRKEVIRYTIETNLKAAISGFSEFSDQLEFAMPKISEENWDIIENNVCVIGFLQGLDIGTKKYNGYAVVANATTNEYVDENSIYIIAGNQYHNARATDITESENLIGAFKIDFERHYIKNSDNNIMYYYPKRDLNGEIYTASYSSIINQTKVDSNYADIYKYMRTNTNINVKKAYYIALARERYGSYKMEHDINYNYYLNNY